MKLRAEEVTRVVAVRHGETEWNAEMRMQGQLDTGLSARGRWQASRVAEALAGEGLEAIFASDLVRAHDTAKAIGWPADAARWRRHDPAFAPDGGESLVEFSARVVGAVTRIAERARGRTILVVSHGGVLDCLYRAASGLDLAAPRSWELGNATINRLLFTGERFTLVGWSDTAHLDGDPLDDGSEGDCPTVPRVAT